MKGPWVGLLLLAASSTFAQKPSAPEIVTVKIEASEWDKKLLLEKLNSHGSDHGLKFQLADEGYKYRVVFATGQEKVQTLTVGSGGSMNASTTRTTVFDDKGTELFHFERGGRFTDKGATNAAAKEIIKRLLQLRSPVPK